MLSVHAVLACFNRRETTRRCLRSLFSQALPQGVSIRAYVVDDGSTDGTHEMLTTQFGSAVVLRGSGQLYWCGGMRVAWRAAARDDPDYFLLLNDDTVLEEQAVRVLLATSGLPEARRIAVGAIADPSVPVITYGGVKRAGGCFAPRGVAESCDTFNANAVLVPRAVYRELGVFHEAYTHAMGDYDYGFAARRAGIDVLQTPCFVGRCARNTPRGTWRDRSLPRRERLRRLCAPKGLPLKEWVIYNRRNTGWWWPYRAVSPYVRVLLGL